MLVDCTQLPGLSAEVDCTMVVLLPLLLPAERLVTGAAARVHVTPRLMGEVQGPSTVGRSIKEVEVLADLGERWGNGGPDCRYPYQGPVSG